MSYDPVAHAEYLVGSKGSCRSDQRPEGSDCRGCFIATHLRGEYVSCSTPTALKYARIFLEEYGGGDPGRCMNWW